MMDNCAREYAFCLQFFGMSEERAIKFFSEVMGKTMGLLLKHEETRIANWYDGISLVLCARVIGEYQKSLQSQNIPCLEPYYGRLLGIIWYVGYAQTSNCTGPFTCMCTPPHTRTRTHTHHHYHHYHHHDTGG